MNIVKDTRNTFKLKNENKGIKYRIIRDTRNLFKLENIEKKNTN